jgi:hypothetical protein
MHSTTPEDIDATIDRLIYFSYVAQREHSPDVAPARWAIIFNDWQAFEAEYQRDKAQPSDIE